jgi:CRISPR-associated endonuclease/helicase Cas3
MIISHIKPSDTEPKEWPIQSNTDHSNGVAKLAAKFANELGMSSFGMIEGLLHDKGKEQIGFQQYIQGVTKYKNIAYQRTPHAFVGALLAKKLYPQFYPLLSYPIMGHHAGLPDSDNFEETMRKSIPSDVAIEKLDILPKTDKQLQTDKQDIHHVIRMLYSCLVDADFLDTESFMNADNAYLRGNKAELKDLLPLLERKLHEFKNSKPSAVNQIRAEIQAQCIKSSEDKPGFFSLTVPTGGGKTISSIVWAIRHAIKYGKKRIIIAIPYTSIITQTAQTLREIFGEDNVLEHHSNTDPDKIIDKKLALEMKLATENWDYPIIVTTNVELFESMFSNKPSSCRKLHNICNSVLILDEVQTLPLEYLQPIVDSLKTYQRILGTTVLFTTASLPALKGDIRHGSKPNAVLHGIEEIKEIIPESFRLHERLRRVNLHFDDKRSSYDEIAERLSKYDRVLCIVNTRKDAMEIFTRLPKEGLTLHLSRMMCSQHIRETIDKIKKSLLDDNQKVIRVIATQLIEAGVDIDFPIVFRQEAGLDSILQAAGRCNREGKLDISDSYVFRLDKPLPPGYISNAANAQKNLPNDMDWFAPQTMIQYFIQLYSRTENFDKADINYYLYKPFDFNFETAAKEFKLIDDSSISVIVNYGNSYELITKLVKDGVNYRMMKKLGQYSVNIHEKVFKELFKSDIIQEVLQGIYFLPDKEQYDEERGLMIENHWLEEILIK